MGSRHAPVPVSVLQAFYQHERQQPERTLFVQPLADGSLEQFTWQQSGQQV